MPSNYYSATGTADTWREWTTTTTASTTPPDTTWPMWVDAGTGDTTVITTRTVTTTDEVWYTWADTTTTTVSNDTWVTWNTDSTGNVSNVRRHQEQPVRGGYVPPRPTPEQIRAQEARQERARVQREETARKRQEAIVRANELLIGSLTQEQQVDMERDGFFFVDSKRPGRRYRLRNGRSGNVDVMENDKVLHRLCAHPAMQVPDGDTRLAQKLMLEHQEDVFLGRANVFPVRH